MEWPVLEREGSRAVEMDQVGILWDGTQDISALGKVGGGELCDCFKLEDPGDLFIESLLGDVFIPIGFKC